MQVIELSAPGLANLKLAERPRPRPGAGEVLVHLGAASLNYLDLMVAHGHFPGVPYPLVPVTDGAGTVAECGADVTAWKEGDRVIPHFLPNWITGPILPQRLAAQRGVNIQGSLAEYAVVPAVMTPVRM